MAKYLLNWSIETTRMPNAPAEIAQGWKMLAALVKKDLETGKLKDWGAVPGQRTGYCVIEGNEMDLMHFTMQYAPFVAFTVSPVSGIDEVMEFLNTAAR